METAVRDHEPPLAEVLAALGDRVAPISLAQERTLPAAGSYVGLFAEGGLVRGRVLSCVGNAATSLALGLIAPAIEAGSWVAVIDVPTLGLDAANELGVPLERVVAVDTGNGEGADDNTAQGWADVVAAAADGFDVLIVRVPEGVRVATVRKVATRLQQRGVVMVVLGEPGPLVCDGVLDTTDQAWSGLGNGWGHLRQRSIEVSATGRRLPGRRCQTVVLPSEPGVDDRAESAPVAHCSSGAVVVSEWSNAS